MGKCVEVTFHPNDQVEIWDSKHPNLRPGFFYDMDEWRRFVAQVKAGAFDEPSHPTDG
jgi:hypothetical protein